MNIHPEYMSNRELEDIKEKVDVELQEREVRMRMHPEYTNEEFIEICEDALTMGLTPDDPDVIAGGYSEAFGEYIAEKERKESMRTTGA
jgi:hypothetical protein